MAAAGVEMMRLGGVDVTTVALAERRAEADSRRAFGAVVREHQAALQAMAIRLCGSSADARDLVQDTQERAFRRFDTFEPGTNCRAWLFTILHRTFIDRCRRRAHEGGATCLDDVDVAAPEPEAPPPWASISGQQLAQAIASLEDSFRTVYVLHAVESLSYQQIAERLGLPVNTVGTRLARARRKLRASLEAITATASEVES
jgi:RNA polymerase sigma-70 factor (ECF subfamily)